jgi:hypothetical protein
MIVLPHGWAVVNEADHLLLEQADAGARIVYRERNHPLAKVGVLVRRHLADFREFVPNELPDCVERVMTAEGEYGALATIAGSERGQPAQRDLGFVFGDDFYALVSSVCVRPAHFEMVTSAVRTLVATDIHALGVRRRRFEYSPPRGWLPIARYMVTDWLAPNFPRDACHLTVYPANPLSISPINVLATLAQSFRGASTQIERERMGTMRTPSGLAGEIAEIVYVDGPSRLIKQFAVMQDARYNYTLEVTATADAALEAHRAELENVFASVQPIPSVRDLARDMDLATQGYWVE